MAWIKYKNKREYLDFYGAALAARYEKQIRRMHADVLVPVPVHPSRKRARGFNQAGGAGHLSGKAPGIPVGSGMLIRDKKTKPQKELSAADRLKNLSGAFRAGTIPEGIKTVLLVDDIYTTGSTRGGLRRALRSAGVSPCVFCGDLHDRGTIGAVPYSSRETKSPLSFCWKEKSWDSASEDQTVTVRVEVSLSQLMVGQIKASVA